MLNEHPSSELASLPQQLTQELIDLGTAVDLIGNAVASRVGINQTDLICLQLLVRRGPMSAGEIAAALGLTTAAISAMATRLEARGYARREMDPKDRRRVLLHVSVDKAREAMGLFEAFFRATDRLYSGCDERDLRMLLDLLGRFRQLVTEHAAAMHADPASPEHGQRNSRNRQKHAAR